VIMATADMPAVIYYSVISFNTKMICEVDQHSDGRVEGSSKRDPKYVRASKKILRKIEGFEIRRPDGMGTLISGTYSYNYMLGHEQCGGSSYPLLESLIFLCVLPLQPSTPSISCNERELAFHFLSTLRRDFLSSFALHLRRIYDHLHLRQRHSSRRPALSVRVSSSDSDHSIAIDTHSRSESVSEEEHIAMNLRALSQVMVQRMHGNYRVRFEYEPHPDEVLDAVTDSLSTPHHDDHHDRHDHDDHGSNHSHSQCSRHSEKREETEIMDSGHGSLGQEGGSTVHGLEPQHEVDALSMSVAIGDDRDGLKHGDGSVAIDIENETRRQSPGNGAAAMKSALSSGKGMGGGMGTERSRVDAFAESVLEVKQAMKHGVGKGDESMPLLGGGAVVRNYDVVRGGFVGRHRSKLAAMLALMLLVYLITATFCGWNVDSCRSK